MLKKSLVSIVAVGLLSGLSADTLKTNMDKLFGEVSGLQAAFLMDKEAEISSNLKSLQDDVNVLLKNKGYLEGALPKEKAHLSTVGVNAASKIQSSIETINSALKSGKKQIAQQEFLDIQKACMTCHNIVRDR